MSGIFSFPKYHIYSDESSQTQHRYLVIGALVCASNLAPGIAGRIAAVRAKFGPTSEMKWGKVKRLNRPMYEAVVDTLFDFIDRNKIQFFALVVDTQKADHKTYNEGDREIGFSKYLFTLLYKFVRIWPAEARYYAFLDDRSTRHTPDATRRMLNAKASKERGMAHGPYRRVDFCQSHKSILIQMTDIITGAIAFETNGHHLAPKAADPKKALLSRITTRARLATLAKPTPYDHRGVDIWHLDFTKAKRKR